MKINISINQDFENQVAFNATCAEVGNREVKFILSDSGFFVSPKSVPNKYGGHDSFVTINGVNYSFSYEIRADGTVKSSCSYRLDTPRAGLSDAARNKLKSFIKAAIDKILAEHPNAGLKAKLNDLDNDINRRKEAIEAQKRMISQNEIELHRVMAERAEVKREIEKAGG